MKKKKTPRPPSGDEGPEHLNIPQLLCHSGYLFCDAENASTTRGGPSGMGGRWGCQVEQISINANTSMFTEPDANGDRNRESEQRPANNKIACSQLNVTVHYN